MKKKKIKQGKEFRLVAVAAISNGVAAEDLSEGKLKLLGMNWEAIKYGSDRRRRLAGAGISQAVLMSTETLSPFP